MPAEGREALDYLEAGTSVDLVLTGLTMPDPDGLEILHTTKTQRPSLPGGVITGAAESCSVINFHSLISLLRNRSSLMCSNEYWR
ncbi:MAG: hypothetical protein DMD83_05810 [Candidatus Rokuibacteriota bacterium]|nr:MAG: hypothetical protein DMD83_05810 [Candidatus Rokubacteria bacterium]